MPVSRNEFNQGKVFLHRHTQSLSHLLPVGLPLSSMRTMLLLSYLGMAYCTGCPVKLFPLGYLLFCWLLLMQIAKLWMILKTSGKLLYDGQMGTIISKIDLEIAEIIEVKVGNHHLEIDILLLHRGRKIIFMLKVATLTSIISAISKSIFKILVPIM